jgi:hypothetical protein
MSDERPADRQPRERNEPAPMSDWQRATQGYSLLVILFVGPFIALYWLLWQLVGRPFAVSSGMSPMTAYDYSVLAWKAERRGQWAEALRLYNVAISSFPDDSMAHERREALLAAHPELVTEEKPTVTPAADGPQAWSGLQLKRGRGRPKQSTPESDQSTPPSTPSSATPPAANDP